MRYLHFFYRWAGIARQTPSILTSFTLSLAVLHIVVSGTLEYHRPKTNPPLITQVHRTLWRFRSYFDLPHAVDTLTLYAFLAIVWYLREVVHATQSILSLCPLIRMSILASPLVLLYRIVIDVCLDTECRSITYSQQRLFEPWWHEHVTRAHYDRSRRLPVKVYAWLAGTFHPYCGNDVHQLRNLRRLPCPLHRLRLS